MPRPAASGWEHDGDEQSAFRTTDANTEENTPLLSQKQNHSLGNMVSKDGVESRWLDFLWIVVACGYMAPMTSVASLISFFKAKYGAGYYVKLYCAYYLPGLPTSLLQQSLDEPLDAKFGSENTFLARGMVAFSALAAILAVAPFVMGMGTVLLVLTVLLGTSSWLMHGAACTLCAMFPPRSNVYLQMGFRSPEITVVLLVSALHIGALVRVRTMVVFLYSTMVLTLLGLASWILLVRSDQAVRFFRAKDGHKSTGGKGTHDAGEGTPLLVQTVNLSVERANASGPLEAELPIMPEATTIMHELRTYKAHANAHTSRAPLSVAQEKWAMKQAVRPYELALFVTICSSIFTAAFFAYVSPQRQGRNIEQVLYFVRLFSDLLGRPLARVVRPSILLKRRWALLWLALGRQSLTVLFFIYISLERSIPRSDAGVVLGVAVFSVLSGYISVLAYECAARACATKRAQAQGAIVLNTAFQTAAFIAVLLSVILAESSIFSESITVV